MNTLVNYNSNEDELFQETTPRRTLTTEEAESPTDQKE